MTTFTGILTATDGSGQTASSTVTLNQVAALAVTNTVSPASGPPGTTFLITGNVTGGTAPYAFTMTPINGVQPQPVAGQPGVFSVTI